MYRFITVFTFLLMIILFTKLLMKSEEYKNEDVILDFDNKKIKCKCNLEKNSKEVKEKFTNYTKESKVNITKPVINNNIVTSIGDLDIANRNNITAESYFVNKFLYPIQPLAIDNSYKIKSNNEYKYLNIGNDLIKVINN